ncbi:hypothetical protein LOTGIDRAFT_153904 [Lottia gigantea]|uniref:Uncharacterized protein n=1 Tax=Lottia gigantea TaxID=225164 RepID=V4A8U1_LOTGI|nr:hypothetical protein LOTGIDRAFT_153904 [Lottia gigantea]ESO91460.1 hypothetical protein LOTGIDRAFT_153904 [Lottia gigantea]
MASAQLLDIGTIKTNNNPSVGANNQKGKKKHEVHSSPCGFGFERFCGHFKCFEGNSGKSCITVMMVTLALIMQAGKKLRVKDKCDVPVIDELASLVDRWFREEIEEDHWFELIKTIARRENCTLVNIKTNQFVWGFLTVSTKIADKKIQNAQTSLVKGAIIVTKLTDVFGRASNEGSDDNLEKALEALALLGHANKQLCFLRRENMKPNMKGEYSHLCSQTLKYTDHLFGDEVSKTVKDISDCSRISNKIS